MIKLSQWMIVGMLLLLSMPAAWADEPTGGGAALWD